MSDFSVRIVMFVSVIHLWPKVSHLRSDLLSVTRSTITAALLAGFLRGNMVVNLGDVLLDCCGVLERHRHWHPSARRLSTRMGEQSRHRTFSIEPNRLLGIMRHREARGVVWLGLVRLLRYQDRVIMHAEVCRIARVVVLGRRDHTIVQCWLGSEFLMRLADDVQQI